MVIDTCEGDERDTEEPWEWNMETVVTITYNWITWWHLSKAAREALKHPKDRVSADQGLRSRHAYLKRLSLGTSSAHMLPFEEH